MKTALSSVSFSTILGYYSFDEIKDIDHTQITHLLEQNSSEENSSQAKDASNKITNNPDTSSSGVS